MRIALVHDYLTQFGGAERVLLALMELFPDAPVYTLLYDEERLGMVLPADRLRMSFLQHVPGARRHHRSFPLLMPMAAEQFDFRDFDVVLSSTHSFSKGIITGPSTLHISYCFTPTRYVWDDCHRYVREFSRSAFFQRLAPLGLSYIRLWDYYASQRVDKYLTLSHYVARRINKYYGRESTIIPPPADIERFEVRREHEGYFLVVARLVPYKRVDIAIDACEALGVPLKVVGTGPEMAALRQRAGRWTEFMGFVADSELVALYQGAKALLFPQEEDFGLTPLEAAACGKPTVAFSRGGALETIIPQVTGWFFHEQTAVSLEDALRQMMDYSWDPERIRAHAETYTRARFMTTMHDTVTQAWDEFRHTHPARV